MAKLDALYANALFELAVERGAIDEFLTQAILLRDSLQDADCRRVLVHPHISAAKKRELFGGVFAGNIRKEILGLLYLVIDKNREAYFIPALKTLISMIERHQRRVTAKVLSASALDKAQAEALTKLLSEKLNKKVQLSFKIDPSVIGGPYIMVDGYYIDLTLKGRLLEIAKYIRENSVQKKERYGA
ncbi:MAG: ATP synthase F1 subunit delta [Oscillospiraceae bacterium]|nr:ATP synthase F1 subunit delta [Oscillospiraceae bacterium]